MSNESSTSETTPLRRPESQISDDNLTALVTATCASPTAAASPNLARSNRLIVVGRVRETLAPTVAAINNNNSIEVRLAQQQRQHYNNNINNNNYGITYARSSSNNNNNNRNTQIKMDTNKRILCRVGLDVLILLCVGFPILCFHLWGAAYHRGFFCDDESLKHPFKDSTVRNWMLYVIGLVIPVGVIIGVEFTKSTVKARQANGNNLQPQYAFLGFTLPDWLLECYKKIGIFAFGAAVSQLTTDIAKYSIGRLRPHFFEVCQPIINGNNPCTDPKYAGVYIRDFECKGIGSSARMLKEVRLSFPSGHSSFTFYTMVYVALYLQSRMNWRGSKLFRHFLQFLFIMIAWYTALSRVSDYKHHWSDVLAGSTIGALVAVIVAKYVSDLFQPQNTKTFLPRTTHDMSTTSQTITTN